MAYAPAVMRRAALAAAAVVVIASGHARAETRSLRIDYEAPATCPDERRFVELARDRVREWPAIDEHGELVARVRTERAHGAFVGRLSLEGSAGQSLGARTIQEASCEDVVLALALFLAVALDADAESHTHVPASRPVDAPAPVAPSSLAPLAPAAPVAKNASHDAPAPPRASPAGEERRTTFQVLARAHGVMGRMPDVVPAAALAVELGARPRSSRLRPSASLGLDLAPYASQREGRGHVELGWGALFGRGCLAYPLDPASEHGNALRVEPWSCARAEAGILRAASYGYATNRTENLGWYAVGAEVGASLWLSPIMSVGIFGQAMVPLVRHDLVLSEALLYRSPWITGEAGLELKMRIW
jgi:hypothetical protein